MFSMLTSGDINKLKEVFATKQDFERFSTKEDLKELATKKDLEIFATKKDLKKFATKKDLEKFATTIDLNSTANDLFEFIQLTNKELKDDIISFKNEILHEIIKLRKDMIVVTEYRNMTINHETRLTKLEKYNPFTS